MSLSPFDDLDQRFSRAEVELPPHLKARLMAVPHMAPQPTFWDLRWIIPSASMVPAMIWLLITKVGPFIGATATNAVLWFEGLVLPTWPVPSLTAIGFSLAIILAVTSAGVWLYLNYESRVTVAYGKYLTSHR